MIVMDTPWSCARKAQELKAAGVDAIIRYYNHRNSRQLPEKRLSRSEAEAIAAAGIRLSVVFQQRQNKLRDFTFDKGRAAGERAFDLAAGDILQPFGSAIYFGVDWDFFRNSELKRVAEFFDGVRAGLQAESAGGPSYRVGAYGSGTVLTHLGSKGLAELFWLAQSTGWSGYKAYKKSNRLAPCCKGRSPRSRAFPATPTGSIRTIRTTVRSISVSPGRTAASTW